MLWSYILIGLGAVITALISFLIVLISYVIVESILTALEYYENGDE